MDHQEIQEEEEITLETVSMETIMACEILFGLLLWLSTSSVIKIIIDNNSEVTEDYPESDTDTDTEREMCRTNSHTLPPEFKKIIKFMGSGSEFNIPPDDPQVVLVKKITSADIDQNRNRFSMPMSKSTNSLFLTDQEEEDLNIKKSMTVVIIEPNSSLTSITLSRWRINNSPHFVLTGEWNRVLERNKDSLKKGVKVKVWSFRILGLLWFALSVDEEEDSENTETLQKK